MRWTFYIILVLSTICLGKIKTFELDKVIHYDLNGDGLKEKIVATPIDIDSFGMVYEIELIINAESVRVFGENMYKQFNIVDTDSSDGFYEIEFREYGPSEDPASTFYTFNDTLVSLGRVEGLNKTDYPGNGYMLFLVRAQTLHTWWYDQSFKLDYDHLQINPIDGGLYLMDWDVTLACDLPLFKKINSNEPGPILKNGERCILLYSDDKKWVEIKNEHGKSGWIKISDFNKIDNVNKWADEVFKGLYMAD